MFCQKIFAKIARRVKRAIQRQAARRWLYVYRANYWLSLWKRRYGKILFVIVFFLILLASYYASPTLQSVLESHYATELEIERLRSLILNVGGALIGAAAIVTSLVLFAMQVNIERMPHGLFRRLSADSKLLGAFALAFLLAIGIAILSTIVSSDWLAYVVLTALWSLVFILISFMYAYRRALFLINPLRQLEILLYTTRNELRVWARRAQRATPLLEQEESAEGATRTPSGSTHDLARMEFFKISNNGTKRALQHAISFARRYAEQGDYEVSEMALNTVIAVNAAYIQSKGRTFFAIDPYSDSPLFNDSVINDTLEHLRQNMQSGLGRRDEQQINQTLKAMAALVQEYLGIDYSKPDAAKSHAQLAAEYLASAVQAAAPHDMADVLLEGQRLMGQCAQYILEHRKPNDIALLSERIALIARTGCVKEKYRPVTMEGMTQLANLSLSLLCSGSCDIRFAVDRVRQDAASVAGLFLNVPDTSLSNIHSTCLGPYYSSTSMQSLRVRLMKLVKSILQAQADSVEAQSVIRNIEVWASGLYSTDKELLLAAIKAKSHFTFDMIYWIAGVTEILLAVSNANACEHRSKKQIREHARQLIAVLAWIPDDSETVKFVENFQLAERLFEAAMDARNRGCEDIAKEIAKYLLSWAFKCGKYINKGDVLERGLCASAVIALAGQDGDVDELKADILSWIQADCSPKRDVLNHAASSILKRADSLPAWEDCWPSIEQSILKADHRALASLLKELAAILLPANE